MSVTACPACSQADFAKGIATPQAHHKRRSLAVPTIHCAGCIRGVESALRTVPGVSDARVNFSLKRVSVLADPEIADETLVSALAKAGYEAHPLNETVLGEEFDRIGQGLAWRMGLAGFAMMNVMLLSVAVWSGATDATRDLFHWISAAIALPATAVAARPFFDSALKALRAGRMNMDVPIALAILLALGMSVYETMQGGAHAYFDAALSLTFFLLVGRYLDHRIKRSARSAARELAALEPARVTVENAEGQVDLPLSEVKRGDIIHLPAGSRVPVDGVIVGGASLLDTSFLTGEADPMPSALNRPVAAGTINLTGPIRLKATAVGDDSSLRRLTALVELAESARGAYRSIADRAAAIYAPAVHLLAAGAALFWLWQTGGDVRFALNVAVATLIITCPCALGLAVPAVATAAISRLMSMGVIVKSDTGLERLAEVDTVLFDKTGTLTETVFQPAADMPHEARGVLKALARASSHPLSRAIDAALSGTAPADITDIVETAGAGLSGRLGDVPVGLGADAAGRTILRIGSSEWPLRFAERPLIGAAEMIEALNKQGYRCVLLSGDRPEKVKAIAAATGIAEALPRKAPEAKAEFVAELQRGGARVLMVGDGLNDTAALAAAHASIAPATALDASRSAADVVVMKDLPDRLPRVLRLARVARRRMTQNFAIAACYNLIAIPFALVGLATPLMAAIAMSTSSITVILNAYRTRLS